jgi:hypothetical protein
MPDHQYDTLLDIMHDTRLPLEHRIDAASTLLRLGLGYWDGTVVDPAPRCTIAIPSMPELWFRTFSPELQADLRHILACLNADVDPMPGLHLDGPPTPDYGLPPDTSAH